MKVKENLIYRKDAEDAEKTFEFNCSACATGCVGIACGENSPAAQTFSAALNRHGLWPDRYY
jgi:hypothetical protein